MASVDKVPKPTLNEIMGSKGGESKKRKLGLSDLEGLLGERLPKLEFTPVGEYRLRTALRNRFGDAYKNLPGIDDIMEEFKHESKFRVKLEEMKMIKAKKGK